MISYCIYIKSNHKIICRARICSNLHKSISSINIIYLKKKQAETIEKFANIFLKVIKEEIKDS